MFSTHRNSYLQMVHPHYNPRLLNRCVDAARAQLCLDCGDYEPPFHRLTSEQPCIPVDNIDPTRRPQAFDRWALPKLKEELSSPDPEIAIQAVASIGDLVHDPEKGYEAINIDIPGRMADLLNDYFPHMREQTAMVFTTLAGLAAGREAIVRNPMIMENLLVGLSDSADDVRIKIATCVEMVARTWMAADALVDFGFIPVLLERLLEEPDEIASINLDTLKSLMYCEGKHLALQNEGFKTLITLLKRESPEVLSKSLGCLAILTSTVLGKKIAMEDEDLLNVVNEFLYSKFTEVCSGAAQVVMYCTVKTRAKHLAYKVKGLPGQLIALMKNPLNYELQLYSIKALTNICEHPLIRKHVLENHLEELTNLQTTTEPTFKDTLLKVLNWTPHFT